MTLFLPRFFALKFADNHEGVGFPELFIIELAAFLVSFVSRPLQGLTTLAMFRRIKEIMHDLHILLIFLKPDGVGDVEYASSVAVVSRIENPIDLYP